jgi:hypothetical protein
VITWIALSAAALLPAASLQADDWKPLFNGKDLSGWEIAEGKPDAWIAEDGMLVCKGGGGGWLSTEKEYANYELELEFRVPPGGNSGVFLRSPREGNPAYVGMEIQVLDDAAKVYAKLLPEQYTGSIYDVQAAMPRVTKPAGEWQTMRILCDGRHVVVTTNGTQVIDANLDDYPGKVATHPGLTRKTGYLGLQNHGSRLEYRNLRIRELP